MQVQAKVCSQQKPLLSIFHCLKSLSMLHELTMKHSSQRLKVCFSIQDPKPTGSFQLRMLWHMPTSHPGLRPWHWTKRSHCIHLRAAGAHGGQDKQLETMDEDFHAALQISSGAEVRISLLQSLMPHRDGLSKARQKERGPPGPSLFPGSHPQTQQHVQMGLCPGPGWQTQEPKWIHHHKTTSFALSLTLGYWQSPLFERIPGGSYISLP